MPSQSLASTCVPSLPAVRALHWCLGGLRLWRRAPLRLLLLSLAPLVLELLLQVIPGVGILLSKLLVPIVGAGLFMAMDELARGGTVRTSALLEGLRHGRFGPLALTSVLLLAIFATQVLVAATVYGGSVLGVLVGARVAEFGDLVFQLVLILPGLLPATLLMLVIPLVLFEGVGPGRAALLSVRIVMSSPAAFGLYALVSMAALAVALLLRGVPLLLFAPWALAANYVAYRDVFRTS
jgi:hypothetical protein